MNLADITTKCYILALIIRDDGERLLLGDGAYEFKDSQQHFIANTYANDVVELQGTDGQMLAGQVRRTATQTFAGYIGDATFSKQKVEEARRDFLMFFRKKHYYTAVYVFSDGTAIQRDRGYIVNAPSVPELYQRFPEWSVGLNFEDPNYYEYAEDDLGHEIAAHKVELELSTAMSGGLIWDEDGAVSDDLSYVGTPIEGQGKNFQLTDTGTATLKSAELLGDATQTTYSGKNKLAPTAGFSETHSGITFTGDGTGKYTISGTATAGSNSAQLAVANYTIQSGDYLHIMNSAVATTCSFNLVFTDASSATPTMSPANRIWSLSSYVGKTVAKIYLYASGSTVISTPITLTPMIVNSATATAYEPYVGGTASPNPDYPQTVNTATGEQTVKIEGKNLVNQGHYGTGHTSGGITANFASDAITMNGTSTSGAWPSFTMYADGSFLQQSWWPTTTAIDTSKGAFNDTGNYRFTIWIDGNRGTAAANFRYIIGYMDGTVTNAYFPLDDASYSFTVTKPINYLSVGTANSVTVDCSVRIQLEKGNQASSFEPYHGQEFEIFLPPDTLDYMIEQGGFTNQGLNATEQNRIRTKNYIPVEPNTQYTMSVASWNTNIGDGTPNFSVSYYSTDDYTTPRLSNKDWTAFSTPASFTTPANCHFVRVLFNIGGYLPITPADMSGIRIRGGDLSTPIELAKIGNYQDRIYKSNGKWYVHKEVGKVVLDGTNAGIAWSLTTQSGAYNFWYRNNTMGALDERHEKLCDNFTYSPLAFNNGAPTPSLCENQYSSAVLTIFKTDGTQGTTVADWKTWLGTHPTTVYYVLATPTTTEITSTELIRQLERLRHAHTYADTTNFSITATSPNLPAFLKVVAFGKDATPQGGYVWEDGGAGGATTITVDGVDNAQPIWTVVGPATNPSLTNITTGESIQWTGVVPNGQTLVVNMADMTASLSGANVFEFISGSWITLQAGNNRVSYSATAATGIATLEWNGVVG